jgi:integration host factor subunit alpha
MTKADLVDVVRQQSGLSRRTCVEAVEATFAVLKETLQIGDLVKIMGFGSFRVRQKRERMGRHLHTKAAIIIAPRKVLTFKPSRHLRDMVNAEEVV